MPQLVTVMKWEGLIFLGALAGIIAVRLLTGDINTNGLFRGRLSGRPRGQDEYFSPERVQLLVITLGAALYYLSQVLTNQTPGKLPDIPQSWAAILGGSNFVYVGGKAYARWFAGSNSK